jgi:hypothetical protein
MAIRASGVPEVRVRGTLHAGTRIVGRNCRMEVGEDRRGAVVREARVGDGDAPTWEMALG